MTNLTAFTYWPIESSPVQNFSSLGETLNKNKVSRDRILFLNNISHQECLVEKVEANRLQDQPKSGDFKNSKMKARPFFCNECGKTFLLKHHLTTHSRTHSGIRPHICTYCGKTFTHKHCLNTHLLLHSGDRPYRCLECKKSFTLKHHLITHNKVHRREKPFTCNECGLAFPVKRHLTTHSKYHAGERPFICEDCGESFAQKEHLVMHSRFHGSLTSFVCNDCGATFTRKFELVNHARHHGKQPHTCTVCQKEFFQKRTLVSHMRFHSENFPSKGAVHIKQQHATSAEMKEICQDCGCRFKTAGALAFHSKLHLGDFGAITKGLNSKYSTVVQNTKSMNQKCVCSYCSKGYNSKHGLQQHQRRNPDGNCAFRSHVCSVCSKSFFQKNHLLLHQRQHLNNSDADKEEKIKL